MLLNEFLKEHRKVEEQGRKLQDQESANGAFALLNNTTGSRNIANSANALGRVVGAGCAAKQEATNTMLESTVARQQREIQTLTASLKEQASQIQKVSDKVEMSGAAPQMVANCLTDGVTDYR